MSLIAGLLVAIVALLAALVWLFGLHTRTKGTAKVLTLSMLRTMALLLGVIALTPIFEATLSIQVAPACKGSVSNKAVQ